MNSQPIKDADMGRLEGSIAVVTGGSSGIGREQSERFVAEGAYVFIPGREQRRPAKENRSRGIENGRNICDQACLHMPGYCG